MTAEDFVNELLEDDSKEILPEHVEEIIASLGSKATSSGKKASGASAAGGGDDGNPMTAIKAAYHKFEEEGEGKEPASKKAKSNMPDKVEAYKMYKGCKNDDLKDILGWNRQIKKGTKEFMMYKCIDGHVFGRLATCPLCTGTILCF